MQQVFFDGWQSVIRTLMVGVPAYVALVFFLRLSGKRTLSKMNAFDLVITIALGSALSSVMISREVSLTQGLVTLALLIGLQFIVAWLCSRSDRFDALVKGDPTLLVHRGRLLEGAIRKQRVTREEVLAAVRSNQLAGIEEAEAVVLETDGTFSVVPRGDGKSAASGLRDLRVSSEDDASSRRADQG